MAHLRKVIEKLPLAIKPPNLTIGRELNRGAYGVVHEGVFAGQQVAVKAIHKLLLEAEGGENALRSFCEECEKLKELDHPHVISEWQLFTGTHTLESVSLSCSPLLCTHRPFNYIIKLK